MKGQVNLNVSLTPDKWLGRSFVLTFWPRDQKVTLFRFRDFFKAQTQKSPDGHERATWEQ
jgi:hypothetical protein